MNLPKRKNPRLKNYDYGQDGAYFLTACSFNRQLVFSEILVGQGLCPCRLSAIGSIIEAEINVLNSKYIGIHIEKYIIMPNHLHLIVLIQRQAQPARAEPLPYEPTVLDLMRELKSVTTKQANQCDGTPGRKIWQFRFHDHVIRNEQEYQKIWNYIDTNQLKWEADCFFKAIKR